MRPRSALLLPIVSVAVGVARLASDIHVEAFAFFDAGAELAQHRLMTQGLRPTVDFGYIYGLWPLIAGRIWYAVWGLNPGAFAAFCIGGYAIAAWGVGRALDAMDAGPVGAFWGSVCVTIGLGGAAAPTITHVLEPIVLAHGLAEWVRGRHRRALSVAAVGVFVKPALSYLLGFAVLIDLMSVSPDRRWLFRHLREPLFLAGLMLAGLALLFGWTPVVRTLFPLGGRAVYRANGFGFFASAGRPFWWPGSFRWRFYFETLAGAWCAGSLLLWVSALRRLRDADRISRVIVGCGAIHAVFVFVLFGNRWSWSYDFPVFAIGLAAVSTRGPRARLAVLALSFVAIVPAYRTLDSAANGWRDRTRSAETSGLWASAKSREAWRFVVETRARGPVAFLSKTDGTGVIDGRFEPPAVLYLVRGLTVPAEIERKRAEIRLADCLVVTHPDPGEMPFQDWPEFRDLVASFDETAVFPSLTVYARRRQLDRPSEGRVSSETVPSK